jgi:predicted DNA-binding transcriptional regulator YafY
MRADRLLSLLLILQTRGRCSAQQLAEELEVSERTIYRDVEALSTSGVPVYTERGPGGGISLVETYRTSLTGLTEDEVQALFMLNVPSSLDQIGVSQDLKTALLKLFASLPESFLKGEQRVRQRVYLDSTPWSYSEETLPCLPAIQAALWNDQKLKIHYSMPFTVESEGVCEPYGLVSKANVWQLILKMSGRLRVLPVRDILTAKLLDEVFIRPPDFDLQRFWEEWLNETEKRRPVFTTRVRAAPALIPELIRLFGKRISEQTQTNNPDKDGWFYLKLTFDSFFAARQRLLGYGAAIEVLEPVQLRLSIADFGRQIAKRYEGTK